MCLRDSFSSSLFQLLMFLLVLLVIFLSVLPYFNEYRYIKVHKLTPFSSSLFQQYGIPRGYAYAFTFSSSLFQHELILGVKTEQHFQFFLISTSSLLFGTHLALSFSSSLFQPNEIDIVNVKYGTFQFFLISTWGRASFRQSGLLSVLPYFNCPVCGFNARNLTFSSSLFQPEASFILIPYLFPFSSSLFQLVSFSPDKNGDKNFQFFLISTNYARYLYDRYFLSVLPYFNCVKNFTSPNIPTFSSSLFQPEGNYGLNKGEYFQFFLISTRVFYVVESGLSLSVLPYFNTLRTAII